MYKVFDKYFDAGWRNFVKGIRESNDISNLRLFKILASIKDSEFVADLIKLMRSMKSGHAYLTLTKNTKGVLLKNPKSENIPFYTVEKYPSGSYKEGRIYIQIKENRWVTFAF